MLTNKIMVGFSLLCFGLLCGVYGYADGDSVNDGNEGCPPVPLIESVGMLTIQPHESDSATIWYDDFDEEREYFQMSGPLDSLVKYGNDGKSLQLHYKEKQVRSSQRFVLFGDATSPNNVRTGEKFDEVYWRVYIKFQYGWQKTSTLKFSRATSLVSQRWRQAMISHIWGTNKDGSVTLDPVSLVEGDKVISERYNDFPNFKSLQNIPSSDLKLQDETDWWICLECRAKLNTPGKADGVNQLWIDGRLAVERYNLNWRGSYTGHGINAVFLESYWLPGSPCEQSRWYDNFVISEKPIGPVVVSQNPILYRNKYRGPGVLDSWELEVAQAFNSENSEIVWKSYMIQGTDSVEVNTNNGKFMNGSAQRTKLVPGSRYYARVRQKNSKGIWSSWSRWHQNFETSKY